MKLPPISELLDDAIMVNESRDLMQGRAFSFAKRSIRRDFCKKSLET